MAISPLELGTVTDGVLPSFYTVHPARATSCPVATAKPRRFGQTYLIQSSSPRFGLKARAHAFPVLAAPKPSLIELGHSVSECCVDILHLFLSQTALLLDPAVSPRNRAAVGHSHRCVALSCPNLVSS